MSTRFIERTDVLSIFYAPPTFQRSAAAIFAQCWFRQRYEFVFDVVVLHRIVGMAQWIFDFDEMPGAVLRRRNHSNQDFCRQQSFDGIVWNHFDLLHQRPQRRISNGLVVERRNSNGTVTLGQKYTANCDLPFRASWDPIFPARCRSRTR